jgi:hypothetical protein
MNNLTERFLDLKDEESNHKENEPKSVIIKQCLYFGVTSYNGAHAALFQKTLVGKYISEEQFNNYMLYVVLFRGQPQVNY